MTVSAAAVVLDRFLVARSAVIGDTIRERDETPLAWFGDHLAALGEPMVDELTARRLGRASTTGPSPREVDAVLAMVEAIPDFFATTLPEVVRASRGETAMAAVTLRSLVRWLAEQDLIDVDVAECADRFLRCFDRAAPRRSTLAVAADR
jgi:hypothetical protein